MAGAFPLFGKHKVAISGCLLGERLRYDGDHRRDAFVVERLGRHFRWVPFCPEFEVGLGVPREPMRLEGDLAAPRLLTVRTRFDHTEALLRFSAERVQELLGEDIRGCIFKRGSPSCGPRGVPIHPSAAPGLASAASSGPESAASSGPESAAAPGPESAAAPGLGSAAASVPEPATGPTQGVAAVTTVSSPAVAEGAGLFAMILMRRAPGLPVADESMLCDRAFAAEFVRQVRRYRPPRVDAPAG